jgi:hypothetical protein
MTDNSSAAAFQNYMKSLAVQNKDLNHRSTEKHFFRKELEEFYLGFRSDVNFPALILESAEIAFTDAPRNAFKERTPSFLIVDQYKDDDDFDQIAEALDRCERIGDEILRKFLADAEDSSCLVVKSFKLSDCTAMPIQNQKEKYIGYRYLINSKTFFCQDPDPDKWNFNASEDESPQN